MTISNWSLKKRALITMMKSFPQPAPMHQRLVAGLVDVAIVGVATGVFALTFVEAAEGVPHSNMTMVCMLAAGGIFWLVFQYIFLVYRRATPGMDFAGLELCTFDGKATTMFERQSRAAASALSGFSMGLGYFWALVDEDRVGWHDRISRTHVRAALSNRAVSSQPKKRRSTAKDAKVRLISEEHESKILALAIIPRGL